MNVTALLVKPSAMTVIEWFPSDAFGATENVARTNPLLKKKASRMLIPVPGLIVSPIWGTDPVKVTATIAPCPPVEGVIEDSTGGLIIFTTVVAPDVTEIGVPAVTVQFPNGHGIPWYNSP